MLIPSQSRAARELLNWTQADLADAAAVGLSTVVDFERQRRTVSTEKIDCIRRTLEGAGVDFIDAKNGKGIGVRLSKA